MAEITKNSTKTAIYDAYTEALEEVTTLKDQNDGLHAQIERMKNEKGSTLADNVLASGVVSEDFVAGIEALKERKSSLKSSIENLTGINDMVLEMDAMIIAKNRVAAQCKTETEEAQKNKDEAIKIAKAEQKKELDAIKAEIEEEKVARAKEEEAYKTKTEARRKAEEEDYKFERDRKVKKDLAELEDRLNEKKRYFQDWYDGVVDREAQCEGIASENKDLKTQIEELKQLAKDQYEEGKADGKKSADKSHVFETRALQKEIDHITEQKEFEVNTLKAQLAEAKEKIDSLQTLLDKAYMEQKDLAKSVAEASRPMVVQNQATGK